MNTAVSRASKKLLTVPNVIFLVLCCVVMYLIFKNVAQIKAIDELFRQIDDRWIIIAIASQLITYLATTAIYYALINRFKGPHGSVGFVDMLKLSIVSIFINQIVPSGGIGGNGFLFNEITKRGVTQKKAFFTIVMECIYLYVAMLVLLITLPLLYLLNHNALPPSFLIAIIYGFLLYGALAVLMTILSVKETLQKALKAISRIKFLRHYVEDITFSPQGTFADHQTEGPWGIFRKYIKGSMAVVLLQMAVFFADGLTIFALLQGLHVHTSFLIIIFGLLLTFGVAAIPISPGSLLVYESAMTFFYTSMGMPFQAAIVVTLLYRVLSFWLPIGLGLGLYKHVQKQSI